MTRDRFIQINDLKIASEKIRLEEIRGMLCKMKFCSECIFQGGDMEAAWEHLSGLNSDDERRFLFCHTLVAGDHIDKSAARALLAKLNPAWASLEDVLPTLPPIEREEILNTKSIMDKFYQPQKEAVLEDKDEKRISLELSKAVKTIGPLPYKEAVWVLIPVNEGKDSIWVQDRPGEDEEGKFKLLSSFRAARWVLHIHNNPTQYRKGRDFKSSASDRSSSIYWKQERPDLEHKMKFFIVVGNEILEYSMVFNKTKIWT